MRCLNCSVIVQARRGGDAGGGRQASRLVSLEICKRVCVSVPGRGVVGRNENRYTFFVREGRLRRRRQHCRPESAIGPPSFGLSLHKRGSNVSSGGIVTMRAHALSVRAVKPQKHAVVLSRACARPPPPRPCARGFWARARRPPRPGRAAPCAWRAPWGQGRARPACCDGARERWWREGRERKVKNARGAFERRSRIGGKVKATDRKKRDWLQRGGGGGGGGAELRGKKERAGGGPLR